MSPDLERIARAARTAHVAVPARSGPHTTPVAVAWASGRLWFLTPRRSVKARAAGRGPVAALLQGEGRTLLLRGTAQVLDPLRPAAGLNLGAARAGLRLPAAGLRYLRTQAGETAAITRDALRLLVDELDTRALSPRSAVALRPHTAVPLETAPGDAVLTMASPDGPLPLPAGWHGQPEQLTLPESAALLLGRDSGPREACLTVVTADAPGLRGKAGLLLRGSVVLSRDRRTAALSVSRATWWRGTATGTLRPADLEEVRRRHAR